MLLKGTEVCCISNFFCVYNVNNLQDIQNGSNCDPVY